MTTVGPRIVVHPAAITVNLRVLGKIAAVPQIAIVKANGYGHGLLVAAHAALAAAVSWLGIAQFSEALTLAKRLPPISPQPHAAPAEPTPSGLRILTWLASEPDLYFPAVQAGLDVSVSTPADLQAVLAAARATGWRARVQLQVETGLHRSGFAPAALPAALAELRQAAAAGLAEVTGVWSHLGQADDPRPPAVAATQAQIAAFTELAALVRADFPHALRHLAASAGLLHYPQARFDAVRPGIAMYGLDPEPAWPQLAQAAGVDAERIAAHTAQLARLRPALELTAPLVEVKALAAGDTVSYGGTWQAPGPRWVGLVPVGYADGVPRHASNAAEVWVGGQRRPVVGRVCMDQFVIDLGPREGTTPPVAVGEEVVLFGSAPAPTADDWARACGTIGYEIVTRLSPRLARG
ncbi:alanine racemase [Buchananella hordeovulneris]|uniref:alanine racemase n=1 Tax=Buchananella hordeovulneris TaxID=52770 RepID=UPI000F5F4821|nr:alanine racemase [Buchananella hordeovulneris]RRD49054.1 alanine racemase [Buchananella hordeovulneris]